MPSQVDDKFRPFAENLRALMLEQRVGGEVLGRRTGISPRLIAKYRAGTTEPRDAFGHPSENARKLALALGVTVDELLPASDGNDDEGVAA